MTHLWDDIKSRPMNPQELADLESLAGRKFLSTEQAVAYRKRLTDAGVDPAKEYAGVERRTKKRKKVA